MLKEVKNEVAQLKLKYGSVPGLAILVAGDNPASALYVNMKEKRAADCGFKSVVER